MSFHVARDILGHFENILRHLDKIDKMIYSHKIVGFTIMKEVPDSTRLIKANSPKELTRNLQEQITSYTTNKLATLR